MTDAIFTFHSIDEEGSVLSYRPDALARFVEGLLEEGVAIVPPSRLLAASRDGRPRAALTFDDAFASAHRHALPLLERLGVPAVTYVVSGRVGGDNRWPGQPASAPTGRLMSWSELGEWVAAGLEVGSHTETHPRLTALDATALERELAASRARLEDRLGVPVGQLAYPYGLASDAVARRAAEVYDLAVTTRMRFLRPGAPPHRLPRIDTYYLRAPGARAPVFGRRSRLRLRARAALRELRGLLLPGPSA